MSSSFQEGFEANIEIGTTQAEILMTVQQCQLVDEYSTQREATHSNQAPHVDLGMGVEDAFEVFVEVLNSQRAQFVEDAPYFSTYLPTSFLGRLPLCVAISHHSLNMHTPRSTGVL